MGRVPGFRVSWFRAKVLKALGAYGSGIKGVWFKAPSDLAWTLDP